MQDPEQKASEECSTTVTFVNKETLQAHGWSHNDICPRNILRDGDDFHLIDLGLSGELGASAKHIPADMLHAASGMLLLGETTSMTDPESLAYSLLTLHGRQLGWEEAAEERDFMQVMISVFEDCSRAMVKDPWSANS